MSPGEHALIYWVAVGGAYVILWWMAFFMLLPIGMYNEDDPPGQFTLGEVPKSKSAQTEPRMKMRTKLLLATGISAGLWVIFYALVLFKVIDL
jgi:predicted secreted protein